MYKVQFFDNELDNWFTLDVYHLKKEAKDAVRDFKVADKKEGLKLKYRIVKLTIKQEVVK